MADTDEAKLELRILKHLLQPSYLSASIAVLTVLVTIGSVVISQLYLSTGWLADALRTIATSDQHLFSRGTGDGSSPFNAVLLFLFWAGVGLVIYFMVVGTVQALREYRELEQQMNFVHTDRRTILRNFGERFAARFLGLVLTFVMAALYLKIVVPYALTTVEAARFDVVGIVTTIVAVIILLLAVHVLAVLLRIVALRPRLFTAEIET